MTKLMLALGGALFKRSRAPGVSSNRLAPRSSSSSSSGGSTSTTTSSNDASVVLRQQFLAELEKDPALFGQLLEKASPTTRQNMMKPFMKSLSGSKKEFAKADKNGDGVLTHQEFEHWLTDSLKRSATASSRACAASATTTTTAAAGTNVPKVSREQLKQLAIISAIPFVGFGFLDNAIMICSGSQIDATFSSFGLSAMAAAALGNTLSDVAGIQAGGLIERMASNLKGLKDPKLTLQQLKSPQVKRVTLISSAVGITVGCLLGMIPLLFMNEEDHHLRRIFDDIDSHKTGTIAFDELESAIQEVGLTVDKDELHSIFLKVASTVDPQREGEKLMTFPEFKKVVLQFEQRLIRRRATAAHQS